MQLKPQWQNLLKQEQEKPYFIALTKELADQRNNGVKIYPTTEDLYRAFSFTDLSNVKVVILGQDPYHGANAQGTPQAHGLAFSVQHGFKTPPSLVNIYKELAQDIPDFTLPTHGNLSYWAEQGVLLLNTVLSVKAGDANSHAKLGWEVFTDEVISKLNQINSGCVFLLWGSHAQKKAKKVDKTKHEILTSPHPSPLSAYRGFFGCKHFSRANQWLESQNKNTIDWQIPS